MKTLIYFNKNEVKECLLDAEKLTGIDKKTILKECEINTLKSFEILVNIFNFVLSKCSHSDYLLFTLNHKYLFKEFNTIKKKKR